MRAVMNLEFVTASLGSLESNVVHVKKTNITYLPVALVSFS